MVSFKGLLKADFVDQWPLGATAATAVALAAILGLVLSSLFIPAAHAAGQNNGPGSAHLRVGPVYRIVEPDLIEEMQAKTAELQRSGKLDEIQAEAIARSKRSIEEPKSLGLPRASAARAWLVDTSYTVPKDLADDQGRVFAHAGDRVNALEKGVHLSRPMLFLDGGDPVQTAQLPLLLKIYANARVVLTGGRWRAVAEQLGGAPKDGTQTVFFDQGGKLVRSFGIKAVPAVVFQNQNMLEVHELAQ